MKRRSVLAALPVCLALALIPFLARSVESGEGGKPKLLYITTTAGFHHSACEYSVPIIKKMAEESGAFEVVATDKLDLITPEGLKGFDGIVFSNTTGSLKLSDENRNALIDSVKGGKAFIGIHAATDTYGDWAPYYEMIGGTFNGHPWTEAVPIAIEDPAHPSASPVPSPWTVNDEIYVAKNYSREKVHVIMSLENEAMGEKLKRGNREDKDYAIAWCKEFGKGKVFYTSLGHRHEVWDDPIYQKHLLGGIRWALGQAKSEISPGHPKVEGAKWVKIFDGESLAFGTDWETTDNHDETRKHWTAQPGGILQGKHVPGSPGSSHLYYIKKKFKNFEFRADVCINPGGNSGMYFRCQDENLKDGKWRNWPAGYEAQVNNDSGDPRRSGTFYPEPSIKADALKRIIGYDVDKEKKNQDYWFNQHIIASGDHIVIKLNGAVATEVPDLKLLKGEKSRWTEGYFAFQFHDPGTVVKFKNLEVRELP